MIRTRFLFLILFSFFISMRGFSQKVNVHVFTKHVANKAGSDTIYYDFNRPLSWKDFQGKIPGGVPWGAMTASGFSFNSSMELRDNVMNINVGVYTFFTKHNSWRKPEAKTAFQLEHEQHHFDITRLGAAKLENEIKKAHFTAHNYKTLLNSIFNKVYQDDYALQKQYDLETHNSMDSAKQEEWNRKIGSEIAVLKIESGNELSSNP